MLTAKNTEGKELGQFVEAFMFNPHALKSDRLSELENRRNNIYMALTPGEFFDRCNLLVMEGKDSLFYFFVNRIAYKKQAYLYFSTATVVGILCNETNSELGDQFKNLVKDSLYNYSPELGMYVCEINLDDLRKFTSVVKF